MTKKVCFPLTVCFFAVLIDDTYSAVNWNRAKAIGDIFSTMHDKRTKSNSRKSHIDCFAECFIRKPCQFISSSYINFAVGRDNPYKCFLYMSNQTDPAGITKTCVRQYLPIGWIPQAAAGACADHKCSDIEICIPYRLPKGGYWCRPVKRKKQKGKQNKKKPGFLG